MLELELLLEYLDSFVCKNWFMGDEFGNRVRLVVAKNLIPISFQSCCFLSHPSIFKLILKGSFRLLAFEYYACISFFISLVCVYTFLRLDLYIHKALCNQLG